MLLKSGNYVNSLSSANPSLRCIFIQQLQQSVNGNKVKHAPLGQL